MVAVLNPPLNQQEQQVFCELKRLSVGGIVNGSRLRDVRFPDFVAKAYNANVSYPSSLQSRVLQTLRDKGYIAMERRDGGTYRILGQSLNK